MSTPNTTPDAQSQPISVFVSYSHRDEALREELDMHLSNLRRQGKISAWNDRAIESGTEWDAEIKAQLEAAEVILLLISPQFMASDYCYDLEMKRAMQRHDEGSARVIPIFLKPTDWQGTPFSKLNALPKDAKPITTWSDRDEAFLNVVQGIRRAVESLQISQGKEFVLEGGVTQQIEGSEQIQALKIEKQQWQLIEAVEKSSQERVIEQAQPLDSLDKAYAYLENLLKEEKWKEADEQTRKIVLSRNENRRLTTDQIRQFSLDVLNDIDRLWTKYSQSRFGLKIQQRLWQEILEPKKKLRLNPFAKKEAPITKSDAWKQFGCLVGWRDDDSQFFSDAKLEFSMKALPGCFPRTRLWLIGGHGNTVTQFVALVNRIAQLD